MKDPESNPYTTSTPFGPGDDPLDDAPLSHAVLVLPLPAIPGGKTTILDAITLALYTFAPQQGGAGGDIVRGRSLAEAEFEVQGGLSLQVEHLARPPQRRGNILGRARALPLEPQKDKHFEIVPKDQGWMPGREVTGLDLRPLLLPGRCRKAISLLSSKPASVSGATCWNALRAPRSIPGSLSDL